MAIESSIDRPMTYLDYALDYAERGLAVFPLHNPDARGRCSCGQSGCQDIGKHPRWEKITLEHGRSDATTDPAQIRAWWKHWPRANIGIVTGRESGIIVLDCDNEQAENEAIRRDVPATPHARTKRGLHILFKRPDWPSVPTITQKDGILGAGTSAEVKADGGYIVAAPSVHYTGHVYQWDVSLDESSIADAPPWLLDILRAKLAKKTPTQPQPIVQPVAVASDAGARTLFNQCVEAVRTAREGERNDTLNAKSFVAGQLVGAGRLSQGDAEAALLSAALACGLEEVAATKTIKSGLTAGIANPLHSRPAPPLRIVQPDTAPTAEIPQITQPAPVEHVSSTWADMGAVLGDLEWHWTNYMPLGMITALVAAGDAGKSQFALHLAKCTLYGGFWPDGSRVETTGKVIWLDTEGSDLITYKRMIEWGIKPDDVIRPRIGDDLLGSVFLDTPQGLEALEREIILHQPRLVVIDTLRGAHTQKERDDDAMQTLLKTLATFAARYRHSMFLNHHITKKHPAENLNVITLDRVRGSSVIANMARVILAIDTPNPESERRRVQVIKCNLAPKAPPLGMDIHTEGLTFTEDAPGEPVKDTTFNRAIEFLKARLASGPDVSGILEADAKEQGISEATLNRARKMLGVVSLGKSANGWLIALPSRAND